MIGLGLISMIRHGAEDSLRLDKLFEGSSSNPGSYAIARETSRVTLHLKRKLTLPFLLRCQSTLVFGPLMDVSSQVAHTDTDLFSYVSY